jgi:DNA-binding MarR family transcriptional regulator
MMQQFSTQEIADLKSQIDEIHHLLASRGGDHNLLEWQQEAILSLQGDRAYHMAAHLNYSVQARKLRKKHFPEMDLSGAAWDMLLDLMTAERTGRELSASDLATGADVPLSSGLRIITALENADLARRFLDHRDRRRSLVRLTDKGRAKLLVYFDKCDALWRSNQHKDS